MELGYLICEIEEEYGIKMAGIRGSVIKDWIHVAEMSYELHLKYNKNGYAEFVKQEVDRIFSDPDLEKRVIELKKHNIYQWDLNYLRPKYFGRIIFVIYAIASLAVYPFMNVAGFILFPVGIPVIYYALDKWRPNSPIALRDPEIAMKMILANNWSDKFSSQKSIEEIVEGILKMIERQAGEKVTKQMDLVKDLGFD